MLTELALISIVGVSTGWVALNAIRRYELGGAMLARFGLIASVVFGIAGPLNEYVAYRLEVPSGYLRVNFEMAMTKDSAEPLDLYVGEKVSLKGYELYGRGVEGQFYLVPHVSRSFGDVVSGVVVELPPGQTWKRNDNRLTVSGTLVRTKRRSESPSTFKLTQAVVRWSLWGWGGRRRGGC